MLVGHAGADDAGVYRVSDDMALVLTVDYFTPLVDDAYDRGQPALPVSTSVTLGLASEQVILLPN